MTIPLDRSFIRCFRLIQPELAPWLECKHDHQMQPWLEHMLKLRVDFQDDLSTSKLVEEMLRDEPHAFDGLFKLTQDIICSRDGLPYTTDQTYWHQLSYYTDSDMLIASHLALGQAAPLREHAIHQLNWPSVLSAEGFSSEWALDHNLADLHVHLGGALPATFYWVALMSGFALTTDFQFWNWFGSPWPDALEEAKQLRQEMFQNSFVASYYAHCNPWDDHDIPHVNHPTIPYEQLSTWQRVNLVPQEPFVDYILHWLCPKRADRCYVSPIVGERLLLWQGFQYLWRNQQPPRGKFCEQKWLRYLRIRNSFLVQLTHHWGTRGLVRFQDTFDSKSPTYRRLSKGSRSKTAVRRRRRMELAMERFRTRHALRYLYADPTDAPGARDNGFGVGEGPDAASSPWRPARQLELRVTPKQDNLELRRLRAYLKGLEDFIIFDRDTSPFRMGLVYHIIRHKGLTEEPDALDFMTQGIHSILEGYPELRRFIVGVDVCGIERNCEPRSLTRFFNSFLFSNKNPNQNVTPTFLRQHLQAFHIGEIQVHLRRTPHVGEDFYDLRTGLRWMDESLRFYGLRPGERVGHGTALAIEPKGWYQRQQKSKTPLRYKIMDLLWLYFLFREYDPWVGLETCNDLAQKVVYEMRHLLDQHRLAPRSLERFFDMGYKRYGNTKDYHSETQFLLRLFEDANSVPDHHYEEADPGYHAQLLSRGALARQLERMVSIMPNKVELRLLHKARNRVIQRYAKHEIVLEVCPTSNMLIGQFDGYAALPYLNINKQGLPDAASVKHPVLLAINSDDPGLFKTTHANEFRLMSQALQQLGYRATEAGDWLAQQRRTGWKACFIPPWSPPTKAELLANLALKVERLRQ